jgi:hypothetical protein
MAQIINPESIIVIRGPVDAPKFKAYTCINPWLARLVLVSAVA